MSLQDELRAVLENTVVEEMFEMTPEFSVAMACARIMNSPVCIWAENDLSIFVRLFKNMGLRVQSIVSIAPKNFDAVDGVPLVSSKTAIEDTAPNKFFFVNWSDYGNENVDKIHAALVQIATAHTYVITRRDHDKIIGHVMTRFDVNRVEYYQSHKAELMQTFDQLSDEVSRRTMIEYLRSYIANSPYRGAQTPARYKYFFGARDELLYKRLNDECWINCGAAIGNTIFLFLSWKLSAKKIYAFERDPKMFDVLTKNLTLLSPELRAPIEPINAMIDRTTDFDSILKGERCTLINADVDGNELDVLISMRALIKRD